MSAQKPALPWSRAASFAWRETHVGGGKFLFVLLSVAIGVAALVGVRGFSEDYVRQLGTQARSLMAGDLTARMYRPLSDTERASLTAIGADVTSTTETISMASAPPDIVPILVTIKAVDPTKYPFYGQVDFTPEGEIGKVLNNQSVAVGEDLLIRLNTKIGATLRLGNSYFRIAAIVRSEPDRLSSGGGLGPRVLMTQAALVSTGLIQPGSRSNVRILIKLPATAKLEVARKSIEQILPDARITDFKESNAALTDGLDRTSGILSLLCLVAMVLGAIGVAMTMHAHLEQRLDIIAIMKSMGARWSDVLRIYLLQTVALGLAGALIGVATGLGVEAIFPRVLGKLLPFAATTYFPWRSVLAGLGTGVLTTLLFCLPPLLEIRQIRPILVLRRNVDTLDENRPGFFARWRARWAQVLAVVVLLASLAGIAATLTDSPKVGSLFATLLTIVLVVLMAAAMGLLLALKALLKYARLHLPSTLRHALANLYRPGNQSAAVLASIGTGIMLIFAVYLTQKTIVNSLDEIVSPKIPNVFLLEISPGDAEAVRALLEKQNYLLSKPELLPVVTGRLLTLNGTPVQQLKLKNMPPRMLQGLAILCSDAVPEGDKVTSGQWWSTPDKTSISVNQHIAKLLSIKPGSQMEIAAGGRQIPVTVAAIFKAGGQHTSARADFVLSTAATAGIPAVWYGSAHVRPEKVSELIRLLYREFPSVTVINLADVFASIESVVHQITFVIRFLAGFSILAGAIILASSVASTRFRRIREVVVLKTLGAVRFRIGLIYTIEFAVLGALAAFVGAAFANLLASLILKHYNLQFHFEWLVTAEAIVLTALLAVGTGWMASWRILGQKPLEILRVEE
jgi:putative ABC transport system permease protein